MTENVVSAERYRPEGADALVRLRHAYKVYRGRAWGRGARGRRPRRDAGRVPRRRRSERRWQVHDPEPGGRAGPGVGRDRRGEGRDLGLLEDQSSPSTAPNASASSGKVRHATSCRTSRCRRTSGCPPPCAGQVAKHDVDGLLELVGLHDRAKHTPGMLSGGEQQRVAIAAALSNTPSILLADEPTAELDSESAARVLDAFRAVNREFHVTIIMVTHDSWPPGAPTAGSGCATGASCTKGCRSTPCPRTVVCGCPTRRSPRSAGST